MKKFIPALIFKLTISMVSGIGLYFAYTWTNNQLGQISQIFNSLPF